MRLWRLTRQPFEALDGAGARQHGTRYSSAGKPVVSFASEAGLAVLVAMRYLPHDRSLWPDDFCLGWLETDYEVETVPVSPNEADIRDWVDLWLDSKRSLLASIPSKVLPEGNVVLFNPLHKAAQYLEAMSYRPFSFEECLHMPPMLDTYRRT